ITQPSTLNFLVATNSEIQRKIELFIVAYLKAAIPSKVFVPANGGDDTEDAAALVPPYCAIECLETERLIQDESTCLVRAQAIYVTHIDDTITPQHSADVRAIHDALEQIPRGYNAAQ